MKTPTDRQRRSEWTFPREYVVPRGLQYRLHERYAWCGGMVRGVIGPYSAPFTLSAALWPKAVALVIAGVVIVSAVRGWLTPCNGAAGTLAFDHDGLRLGTCVPSLRLLHPDAVVHISAASSRAGEVLCWPIRRTDDT